MGISHRSCRLTKAHSARTMSMLTYDAVPVINLGIQPMWRCALFTQHINHLHLLSCLSWTLSTMQAKQSANRWEKYRRFSSGSCFQHLILGIWGFGDHFIIFIPPRSLKSDRCADFRSDPFGNILMMTISKNFQCLLFEYLYFMKTTRCQIRKSPLILLLGGIPTPLKNMKVSWDHYSQYMEK